MAPGIPCGLQRNRGSYQEMLRTLLEEDKGQIQPNKLELLLRPAS